MNTDKRKNGTPLIVAAAVLWGMMGIFVRSLNGFGFGSMQIVALRVSFSAVMMGAVLLVKDKSLFKVKFKDLWCFLGTGICSIVFFNFCYFRAIELTSLSAAAVMLYTAPIMVMVMSLFLFKEKINSVKIAAAVLAFAGCALVTGVVGGFNVNGTGVLLGLGSAFGYALYSIFSRFAINRGYGSLTITFYTFLFASAGVLPFAEFTDMAEKISASPLCIVTGILLALLITVAPYLLYTAGLENTSPGKASVMASVEPVMATVVGILLFKEKPDIFGIVGIVMVIASVAMLNMGKNKAD